MERISMAIRAIIWDVGGVLVRTEDRTTRQQLAARLGMTYEELGRLIFDSPSAVLAALGKITTQAHWESVRKALKLSPEELTAVPDMFWGGDYLDRDLVDYIRSLRPRYRTGLLSNAWDDLRSMLTHKWQIIDAFNQVIISAEVGVTKPDPRIYRIALGRLEVQPYEAVFIDDFAENLEGAQAVGLHTIHFMDPAQARADLEKALGKYST
jgi:epoxide hydrolase-like predicted phosphatase